MREWTLGGGTTWALGMCVLALLACKKSGSESRPEAEKPAPAAPAPTTAAPTAAPAPADAAPPAKLSFSVGEMPLVPTTASNPPQGGEWDLGVVVNTQGANARAKQCSMRILREWLNIYCTGDVIGYEKKEDFGRINVDYYEQISPGKFASFVVRLKPGHSQKIRICRSKDRASLFVNWPDQKDRPVHVALGNGPVCDGSDWGAGYGKKDQEQSAARFAPGGATVPDDQMQENLRQQAAAAAECKNGNSDACMFYCGSSTCN
jgi:hypothetical protein